VKEYQWSILTLVQPASPLEVAALVSMALGPSTAEIAVAQSSCAIAELVKANAASAAAEKTWNGFMGI
jgi:hypothetical protein